MNRRACNKHLITLLLVTGILFGGFGNTANSSALTYSQDIGVNFTFSSTLQLTLSSNTLKIDNLAPGTASDSNIINLNVLTNSTNGYTLNATVGNNTTYNSRDLVHNDNNQTAKFTSVDFGSSIASNTNLQDNTWAYSYSTDNGTNWEAYDGLPIYSDETNIATLKESTGPVADENGDNIKFKIAAKAANSQIAGTYNNVINFTLVATPIPTTLAMAYANANKTMHNGYYTMQDMNSNICDAVEVVDDQLQVIDTRDNKVYWIAKLADGNCWMTQNLDLDIDENVTYTYADTDLGRNWNDNTIDTTATWTPESSTIKAVTDMNTAIVDELSNSEFNAFKPNSVDTGQWYWSGLYYDADQCPGLTTTYPQYIACDYVSKRTADINNVSVTNNWSSHFNTSPYSGSGTSNNRTHGHVGNYYNWTAAIARNDSSSYVSNTLNDISQNPTTSICPANWRLPIVAPYTVGETGDNDFYNLYYSYYGDQIANDDEGVIVAPLYYARSGVASNRVYNAGAYSTYWSSTVSSSGDSYYFRSNSTGLNFGYANYRSTARPIRCLAR